MRQKTQRFSFRNKLFFSMTLMTVLLLVACTGLLILLFEAILSENMRLEANEILSEAGDSFEQLSQRLDAVADAVARDETIASGLGGGTESARTIYTALYAGTEGHRDEAQFSLYDANGYGRFSTDGRPTESSLPVYRGVLYAARESDSLVWTSSDTSVACRAAKAIYAADGTLSGYLVIDLNRAALEAQFSGLSSTQIALLLLDGHWRPIFCSDLEQETALAEQLRARLLAQGELDTENSRYSLRRLGRTGFTLLIQQPLGFRTTTLRLLSIVSVIMVLLGTFVCILVSVGLSRQLNDPLERLKNGMAQLEGGDLNARVSMPRKDEFGMLAGSFNRMAQRLKDNMEQLLRGQKELDDAQIRMMQAQLNPHFLCNTLDTIKWMGKIHNAPEVAEISTDLADILRTSISTEEFIPLDEELDLLHRYIDIQRIRFPGKFECAMDVPPALLDCIIPKLMLQPLVENAILHGLDNRDSGVIRIHAEESEPGRIRITVSDNGCGIRPDLVGRLEQREDLREGGHLGLYNVNMILKKHYGTDYGLTVQNEPSGGAAVSAVLPIIRKEPVC